MNQSETRLGQSRTELATNRKLEEAELRESEERFRSVWESSLDGMRLTDSRGRIIAVNEAYCQLVKLPREKLLGELFSVTYLSRGLSNSVEVYQERFNTGTIIPHLTTRVKLWNSEELDVDVSSSFIELGERGRMVLSIFRDISDRTRAEQQSNAFSLLGQKLSAAKTAREAAQIIVAVADTLLGWDACVFDLYSASADIVSHVLSMDLIEGRRTECSAVNDHQPPTTLARRALREGGQLLLRHQPADLRPEGMPFGDTRRPSASILFVPVRNGLEVIGLLSIQSYTPKAYNERSLATLQALADHCGAALDRIRAHESLQATQEQLRQAAKMEAIGHLAGGVAHDFNNLLVVMRGNAELALLDLGPGSDQTRECLQEIIAAAERSANLTRQLLTFSRKQVMQFQPLVLNDVVVNLSRMLKRIIGENIDLQCRYDASLPHVRADPGMLEQVLVNLVVNARDAMPHGGQLQITTALSTLDQSCTQIHPEAQPGDFVCLTVRDTGAGIAPEHLARIFEPFFTTKPVGKGTGLGLATAYGIVKQHQGWIDISSRLGEGTVFQIYLPSLVLPPSQVLPAQAEPPLAKGTETILLVEDDYSVRMITRRVLESVGYKIHEAASAREAVTLWEARGPSIALLLTDVVMPEGISGRNLAAQLRTQQPGLKVVFMSGYSPEVAGKDTDFFRRSKEYFIQKPCPSRVLLETLRRCLDDPPAGNSKV